MTIRSDRLWGPQLLPAGATEVYPPNPDVDVTLVKSVRIVNVTDEPQAFDFCIGTVEPGNARFWRAVVPAFSLISDGEWWCLENDQAVIINADNADALTVHASGAKLR